MNEALTFGHWLRQRRATLGVTQDQFAGRLGFSPAMLRKLESGERRPSSQIAALLADYFRIATDEREAFMSFARSGSTPTHTNADDGSTAPWRALLLHKSNLPSALTSLIGRGAESAQITAQLLSPAVRLLTLVGPPGIGKTRLALQVAAGLVSQFRQGVYFVDLASVSDPDEVICSTARAIGLQESKDQSLAVALQDHLREKHLLLLLDNFEQVLDAAVHVVRLLESSPWLKVIVTSREALHVRGERRYAVPPLGIPDVADRPSVEMLSGYPSAQLFIERAEAVASGFELLESNVEDVAAVCVGLEGLPLAIELAASRSRHLSPREMRTELARRLELSTGGARDLPARHRTLQSAIEWSYNLLERDEQRLFRRLGVFVGGFTLGAAQAVAGEDDGVTGSLLSLVDKHLVKEERPLGEAGDVRFGMLETIREYALKQLFRSNAEPGSLGRGEANVIHRRHAHYFTEWAEQIEPELKGSDQVIWLAALEREYPNLRAALEWSSDYEPEITVRLMSALRRFWYIRGHFTDIAGWFDRVLAKSAEMPVLARAKAWHIASGYVPTGRAVSHLKQAIVLAREAGDKTLISDAQGQLGFMLLEQGDFAGARALFGECLLLDRERGDKYGICWLLTALGEVARSQEDYAGARLSYEEGLALAVEAGNKYNMAHILGNLGWVALAEGKHEDARRLISESLSLRQELGHTAGIIYCLAQFAALSAMTNQPDKAAVLSGAVEKLLKAAGAGMESVDKRGYERCLAVALRQHGEAAWEVAQAKGRTMTAEEALTYAFR